MELCQENGVKEWLEQDVRAVTSPVVKKLNTARHIY